MRRLMFRPYKRLFMANVLVVALWLLVIYSDVQVLVRHVPSPLKKAVFELSDLSQWPSEGVDRLTVFKLDDEASRSAAERNHLCNMSSFAYDAAIAMEHLAADYELLKSRFDSCTSATRDQLSLERLVRVERSPRDGTSTLRVNASFFAPASTYGGPTSTCSVQRFDKRMNESEESENIDMLDESPLVFNASADYAMRAHADGGYYYFRCVDAFGRKIVEHVLAVMPADFAAFVATKTKTKTTTTTTTQRVKMSVGGEEKMNVLMIGIDSVSRHHFRRVFPRTYEFLADGAHASHTAIFRQFSSLGTNTYPNIIAMLTGLVNFSIDEYELKGDVWPYRERNSTFHDRLPFVWNDYAEQGYATIMQEDYPAIGVFNFRKNGFRAKPTHVYGRAYWSKYYAIRSGPDKCHYHTPTYDTWLEQTELTVQALNGSGVPYFALNYMTEYTHE